MKKKGFLILLFVLTVGYSYAQVYNIRTYTVNDGLPSSYVYDVALDENGLVWFATSFGLAEFDGFTFNKYGIEHGLKDEFIYDIYIDSKQNFWVATQNNGVAKFQGDTLIYPGELARLDSIQVLNITESSITGDLWFSTTFHGVFIWDGENFHNYNSKTGLPHNKVWDVFFASGGNVWIATDAGVAVYKEGTGITKIWDESNGLSSSTVYDLYETSDGTMWISTQNGITKIKGQNVSTVTQINGEPINAVYNIVEDDNGVVWIGTSRKGLYWYDGQNYTHITKKNGLSSNYIYRLIKADDGTIWIATEGNGVSLFKDRQFKIYDNRTNLNTNSVFSLFADADGALWSGTDAGISKFWNGKFTNYDLPENMAAAGDIWDIEKLPNGNLLLLSYNYWLIEFDGENFFLSDFHQYGEKNYVLDVLVDDGSSIWMAGYEQLLHYKNGELKSYKPEGEQWKQIYMIFKDSKGNIWLGTAGGAVKLSAHGETFYSENDGLLGEGVYDITEDDKGNIWLGTNDGISVIKFTENAGYTIESFENEDVFLSETISLIYDNKGGLWQTTNSGINYYGIKKWYTTNTMDILFFPLQTYGKGMEFSGAAAAIDNKNNIWFGTPANGLVKYENDSISVTKQSSPPRTFIRKVFVNSKLIFDHTIGSQQPVQLDYNQNNIEINFAAVNYKDPERIFYRYKLRGFETDWNTGFDVRNAMYTNLEPGQYSFLVKAKSTKSGWADSATIFNFEIQNPYWKSGWFLLIVGFALAVLIVVYLKIHLGILEKRKLKTLVDDQTDDLKKALSEKEVLIKEIHHRVKNNMAVVSGLLELQGWQLEDGPAKNAIEDSKLRIKAMSSIHEKLYQNKDLTNINLKEFIRELVENISNSLKGAHKDVSVRMDIEVEHLDINSAIPCGLMLNELISNSYEHAFPDTNLGKIDISFSEKGENYLLQVSDNGIGLPEHILQENRTSLGITLIQSLSEQVGGQLNIDTKNGTVVTLLFPK